MPRVGIALGSNLGDRLANLKAAREALREVATPGATFLQAPTYQTEPLHCPPDSPFFYNSVVELAYEGTRSLRSFVGFPVRQIGAVTKA